MKHYLKTNHAGGLGKNWRKENNMSKQVYTANELAEVLGVSVSKAYGYIRQMNEELQKQGFLVVRGKIPVAYVQERFFGMKANDRYNHICYLPRIYPSA